MSSKRNISHEFQFTEASRNRKKIDIDGFRLIEASKDEPKQKEEENKTDGFQSKYEFRKSLAWDSAFFTSPGVLDPEELFETLNISDGDKGLKEPSGLPSESMAASRIDECSARRSLAWDAAFFTSPGVLNPEELSLVNNGYRKSETVTHVLPGIEQEFWKSTESDSTLDSDYSLSSLEIDLFDDMRASMQKSSKASNLLSSSCKLQSQISIPNPHFSKSLDPTATRVKQFPASRRPKTTADGVGKTSKEAINPSKVLHGAQTGEHEPSSFLKLSKEYDQVPFSHGVTNRATMGTNQMKVKDKIRKAVPGTNMSKKPCIGDHGTPSPESSSSRSRTASKDLSGSVCGHSASTVKSPSSLRRKNDLAASDSGVRTPKRSLALHKSKLIDSSRPTGVQSTTKSPSTSLLTSIDCLSSESSASLDHVNTENSPNDQLAPSGSKEMRFPHQDVGRFSKRTCHLPSTVSREAKPSGLRPPSTKTGFIELGNSRELTPPNGVKFHSGLQSSSKTRTRSSHLNGTPTSARYSELQSPKTSTRTAKLKKEIMGSPQNGTHSSANIKPNAKLEGEKASQELRSSWTIESSASSFVAETGLSSESGNRFGTKTDSFRSYVEGYDKDKIRAKSQMVGKSSHDQNQEIFPLNRDEKENLFSFKSQVDVLTKQIEAIDVNADLAIEL